MSTLLKEFNKEYDFLYDNGDRVAGYQEAVKWFDDNHANNEVQKYRDALVKERGDFISSDREAAAFAFACETLNIG